MERQETEYYSRLKADVEKKFGSSLGKRGDFDQLSSVIYEATREMLSSTTLRRFWGYQSDQNTRCSRSTLNVLAHYIGYRDWNNYCTKRGKTIESGYLDTQRITCEELTIGQQILLTWLPDREVTLRYEGDRRFTIVKSLNSKLRPGGICTIDVMLQGEQLLMLDLTYPGESPICYACGTKCGVKYQVL